MSFTKLGIAITEITPPFAIPLAGYADRRTNYQGISKSLFARAWVFICENEAGVTSKALLVQSDLIWWDKDFVTSLKRKLHKLWSLLPAQILFHASHTHGGPQTTAQFSPLAGRLDSAYLNFLEEKLLLAIAEAYENIEPVSMEKGIGSCEGISINRRKIVDGSVVMAPNPDGVNDTEVTVIRFVTGGAKTKGVLFHFTCHPTTTADTRISSDYCGAAMELLDQQFGAGASCFLQGFCGDIRPSLFDDNGFYSGNEADVERNGAILADVVLGILQSPMKRLKPVEIMGWAVDIELPFQGIPSHEDLLLDSNDSELKTVWKQMMLAKPNKLQTSEVLQLQLLQLADDLALLAMDGEIVVEYGLLIKRLSEQKVLPLGYSNGMVGYIPTASQIVEGGYESIESGLLFGYSSPFDLRIEKKLQLAIELLLKKIE